MNRHDHGRGSLRRSRVGAGLLVALVAAAACGGSIGDPSPTASVAQVSQALTGPDGGVDAGALITISGTVADSQFPQAGIIITLSGSAQGQVVTDFSGTYSFSVKPGGSYSLTATGSHDFFQPPFSSCLQITPSIVNLNQLATSATVNFLGTGNNVILNCAPAEVQGATSGPLTVSGRVLSGGLPVPGVNVAITGSAQGERVTDETGAYSFSVGSGSYSLNVSGPCASFSPSVANLNNVRASQVENFTGTKCPPAPLNLCPTFDAISGLTEPASCATSSSLTCAGDRIALWSDPIENDWFTVNAQDCRFGKWNVPPVSTMFTLIGLEQDFHALDLFGLQLFGCALAGNLVGPLPFPLIPTDITKLSFTTADLAALSDEYVSAINQFLSDSQAPALTAAQSSAISAQLLSAASRVPGVKSSSTLTYSTCP